MKRRIVAALAKEGLKVATAANSKEALAGLAKFKPELIILGEERHIDGFAACYQLRQAVDVPIIMLGAVTNGEAWTRVMEAGADSYLVKPFSYLELTARVKALLRRREHTKNKNNNRNTIKEV